MAQAEEPVLVEPVLLQEKSYQTVLHVELDPESPISPLTAHTTTHTAIPPRMAQLLDQAPETLHNIFLHVEPSDLASLARTCHYLNTLIQNDELLWKFHYLSRFDPPQDKESASWRSRMTGLVNVQKILESADEDVKTSSLDVILPLATKLARESISSSTKITDFLGDLFQRPANINSVLCKSSLFARARPRRWPSAPTEALRQLSAELHVLAGVNQESVWPTPEELSCPHIAHLFASEDDDDDDSSDDDDENEENAEENRGRLESEPQPIRQVHPYARSRVYDLRRYTAENMWGPFMDDGSHRVDWEKVQAIMIDLAFNQRVYTERRGLSRLDSLPTLAVDPPSSSSRSSSSSRIPRLHTDNSTATCVLRPWDEPFTGLAPGSYTSHSLSGKLQPSPHPDLDALDPYGVTGTWMRIVCFLDYNDLYRFNFESPDIPLNQERDPITRHEAFRLIRLQLHVVRIEEPEEGDGKDFPRVYFEGSSRSTFMSWDPNANSRIRGYVRQTRHGAIHWTTFSIFHGEERWRSEGVQIGGPRSARGILGSWFDKDYDVHGPAGPTAFWKLSDDIVEERRPVPQIVQIVMGD